MNLHPMIVHFPIALLTIYCVMEFFDIKKLRNNPTWFYIKFAFLFLGLLGAYASLTTGEIASEEYNNLEYDNLIETHQEFAEITTNIFLLMTLLYIIHIASIRYSLLFHKNKLLSFIAGVKDRILFTPIKYLLVLAGLVFITLTGALGGVLVYGPEVDPIVSFIYNLLF